VRPFGVRGEVKVLPMTDNAERFRDIRAVFLNRDGSFQREELEHVKVANNGVILKLENIGTRDEAEQLKDQLVYIDRNNAAPIDESSHYYCDIQGCTVRTLEGDVLGTVFDIQNAGSCDVYFVRPEGSRDGEILIPAIRDVVKKIDTEGKEILIDVIDGLL
jgi:16S rRNA processing protein RimM